MHQISWHPWKLSIVGGGKKYGKCWQIQDSFASIKEISTLAHYSESANKDVDITSTSWDQITGRLATGASDGTLKIWQEIDSCALDL